MRHSHGAAMTMTDPITESTAATSGGRLSPIHEQLRHQQHRGDVVERVELEHGHQLLTREPEHAT
jgi:hypothetical protein